MAHEEVPGEEAVKKSHLLERDDYFYPDRPLLPGTSGGKRLPKILLDSKE